MKPVTRYQRIRFELDDDPDVTPAGPDDDPDMRLLSGLVVPYGVETTRFGVPVVFTASTTFLPEDLRTVKLLVQHDDERPIGYATDAAHTDDGLRMTFAVSRGNPRAAGVLDEVDAYLRDGFSVGVELDDETIDAVMAAIFDGTDEPVPFGGTVREVSVVSIPQFNGARVGAAPGRLERFELTPRKEAPSMETEATTAAPPAAVVEPFSLDELAAQLAPLMAGAGASAHPLSGFATFADYVLAGRSGDVSRHRESLALVDQVTANNPGVMQPSWLPTILGIIDRGRPAISAFGGPGSAGDSGMEVDWPYYDGGFMDLVAKQETEKTEVHSRRVDIKRGSAALETYAGASDISYQLLRRSSPSYREAYGRILAIGYGVATDVVFSAAIADAAAANPDSARWDGTTLESFTAALFDASTAVDDAAGVPASVVLASSDEFAKIGSLAGLVPPQYGTRNVEGTTSAATLRINISGIEITKARYLAPGVVIVSTPEAARWLEDGPFPIEADDVPKLGRDVGIWGMGATRLSVPGAIVGLAEEAVETPETPAETPAAAKSSTSSTSSTTSK